MRRPLALLMVLVLVFTVLSGARVRGESAGAIYDVPADTNIVLLDSEGAVTSVPGVTTAVDSFNHTISLIVQPTAEPVLMLLNESWVNTTVEEPSFANASYHITSYNGEVWFGVPVPASSNSSVIEVSDFQPEVNRPVFSEGSPASIRLERPMNISVVEVPHVDYESITLSNANGTWVEERPVVHDRLGISFTDVDTSGQTVAMNRSWLAQFGIGTASFSYSDGTPIPNATDGQTYFLEAPHFSILYTFTSNDNFYLESGQPDSDLHWDSANRNMYLLSDRRDLSGTNEMYRSWAPMTFDQTTSFTIRATWKTSQQGNWQNAVPLFFMASSNRNVDTSNSFYILYASRASNLGYQPYYYFRYRDSTGTLRVNYFVNTGANLINVQLEFMIQYNAYGKFLTMVIFDIMGNQLGYIGYSLGATETFSVTKMGSAAWGSSLSLEPVTVAKVDNLFLDANGARNGNFELDTDSNGVPDYWQGWIWTKGPIYRSQDRAKYGGWSVKIADSSSTNDYGLQTFLMTTSPGVTQVGSSWVYAASGSNTICVEYWDSSGGSRVAVACKRTATHNEWEYLDVMLKAPTGAYRVDLLLYSSGGNVGTGYFDGAELRQRRSFWSVTVHNGEPNLPAGLPGWQVAIDKAADAGVSYIRTDFPWVSFQPNPDQFDENVVGYFQQIRNMAHTRGIDLVAIIKGPEPSWVTRDNIYEKFHNYCEGMGVRFGGGSVPYFQILNEPNFELNTGDVNTLTTNCYTGLLGAAGLDDFSHKSLFKTVGNLFVQLFWDTFMRNWVTNTSNSLDILAIDYYPLTNNPYNDCHDWSALDTLFQIMQDYHREGAITETGFSNYDYFGNWRGDTLQSAYIDCVFPVIYDKGNTHNANSPTTPLLFANWYELFDHFTGGITGPLDWYGLISPYLVEKVGYANFRTRVPGFNF